MDNKLLGKAKTDVINHLRVCDECRLLMAETSTFLQTLKNEKPATGSLNSVKYIGQFVPKKIQRYIIPIALTVSVILALISVMQIQEKNVLQEEIQGGTITRIPSPSTMPKQLGELDPSHDSIQRETLDVAGPYSYEVTGSSTDNAMPLVAASSSEAINDNEVILDMDTLNQNMPVIYFSTGSDKLDHTNEEKIKDVLDIMIRYHAPVRIIGNGDDNMSEEESRRLGFKRADTVKKIMVNKGIEASRITLEFFEETNPDCNDETSDCLANNKHRLEYRIVILQQRIDRE